jgi:hypothetical protein
MLCSSGSILVQASGGVSFDETAFRKWIARDENFAIFDMSAGIESREALHGLPRVIIIRPGWPRPRVAIRVFIRNNCRAQLPPDPSAHGGSPPPHLAGRECVRHGHTPLFKDGLATKGFQTSGAFGVQNLGRC